MYYIHSVTSIFRKGFFIESSRCVIASQVTMEVIIYKRGSRKTHSARKPQAFERTNNAIHSLTYGALCPIIVARILKSWIRLDAIAAKCPYLLPAPPLHLPWNHSFLGPMEISRLPWRISRDSLSVLPPRFPFSRASKASFFAVRSSLGSIDRLRVIPPSDRFDATP